MADTDPTGGGSTVVLALPADHAGFLRGLFEAARAGVRDELATVATQAPPDPARLRREDAVYGRLLLALESSAIEPDRDLRDVLADLARALDDDNEYERIAWEHAVLWGLVHQLGT